jgi:uncharacterized glyoxalase superfamily protein PhnB
MKMSLEVYTQCVKDAQLYYENHFNFVTTLEAEGFVVMKNRNEPLYELMFCVPDSPFVDKIFHPEYNGKGVLIQFTVSDIEAEYRKAKENSLNIALDLVTEEFNGTHFTLLDPAGMLVDVVSEI